MVVRSSDRMVGIVRRSKHISDRMVGIVRRIHPAVWVYRLNQVRRNEQIVVAAIENININNILVTRVRWADRATNLRENKANDCLFL
jgi:AICAR transformylase/IMP cyclohydrolase PurH